MILLLSRSMRKYMHTASRVTRGVRNILRKAEHESAGFCCQVPADPALNG